MKKILILLVVFSSLAFAQNGAEHLRLEAVRQMESGKYGEAIDLLNRFISAEPQNPEGYNLRGLAHERRAMYEMAVYDFRSARKLAPKDREILNNLNRATEAWYKLLYNKIEGHKREIAINPDTPVNYLEIGKSYKNLGEWSTAETWYDEYLKREEASPDEIIRYTEILSKNNHISKGEPILKRYVEKYPDDQRLWSRYGYFTMWLGKKKIAIDAFEHSLAIKPYFQEALDGLDLAKGKGYIYTVNDTSYRYSKTLGMIQKKPKFEYAIDKYFRILKKNPKDQETRFKLIKELIRKNRFEEANTQIEILTADSLNAEKYKDYIAEVKTKRDSLIAARVESYIKKIEKNPNDKETVIRLATHYAGIQDYDNAMKVLENYLMGKDEKKDQDVRYMYARYAAWDYRFREALEQLEILLKYSPDNTDYQLLRGQVAVWTDQDLDKADFYLTEVLKKHPDNLPALLAAASLKIKQQDYAAAKIYITKAYSIDSKSKDIEDIQSTYEVSLASYELYKILYAARDMVDRNDCAGALLKYDEYFTKISAPSRLERIEYASVVMCTKDFKRAAGIYDQLLAEEYDYDIAVLRAKAYLWGGDSIAAVREFEKLSVEKPEDFDANFFYGVSLAGNHQFSEAEDVYDRLLTGTTDSSRIKMINDAKSWLPPRRLFGSFPSYLAIAPVFNFYDDNAAFTLNNAGLRLELGLNSFLAIGGTFSRAGLEGLKTKRNMTTMKGNLFLNFSSRILLAAGFGIMQTKNIPNKNVYDAILRYQIPDLFTAFVSYEKNDARLVLYSPFIIDTTLSADVGKVGFNYTGRSGIRASGEFTYLKISDKNEGNNVLFRLGKYFRDGYTIGYEYNYLNYSKKLSLYWSPQNFDSHCLWGDWEIINEKEDNFKVNLGGKLGYIPEGDFMIREISGGLSYKPLPYFVLSGKITAGSTYKFDASYNYVSAFISAYWSLF